MERKYFEKCNTALYKKNFSKHFLLFKLGSVDIRDIRKNVLILQEEGSTPISPTLPVIRVVFLHTEHIVQGLLGFTVYAGKLNFSLKQHNILLCNLQEARVQLASLGTTLYT